MTSINETGELDQHLASSDFCDRLILVSTSTAATANAGNEKVAKKGKRNEVAIRQLWPALKFDSLTDLFVQIDASINISHVNRLKGQFAVHVARLKRDAGVSSQEGCGVAYLLGRKIVSHSLIILPVSTSEVFNFFNHIEEMSEENSYCGQVEFKSALDIAMARMETMFNNTPLLCKSMNQNGQNQQIRVSDTKSFKMKTFEEVEYSSFAEMERSESASTAFLSEHSSIRTGSSMESGNSKFSAKKEIILKKGTKETSCNQDNNMTVGEKTSIEVNENQSVISPLRSPLVDVKPSAKVRIHSCKSMFNSKLSWPEMWRKMKREGWSYYTGSGLVSYYYVHPNCTHMTKVDLLQQGREDKDYFSSEKAVQKYARTTLGWKGDISPSSSVSDSEMVDRTNKRKLREKFSNHTQNADIAMASMQKKKINVKKGKKAKMMNSQTYSPPSETSDISRFSVFGDSPSAEDNHQNDPTRNTSAKLKSPEVTGLELEIKRRGNFRKISSGKEIPCITKKPIIVRNSYSTNDAEPCTSFESEDESFDPSFKVLKNGEAWELLINVFGFSYKDRKYCLPGKENRPGKDSNAQEGTHFFSSIDSLRKDLCAFGLPLAKRTLSEKQKVDIERWVRLAHVVGLSDGAYISIDPIKQSTAWKWLQNLGFKYSTGYVIPSSDGISSKKFERAVDFYSHLARFGIPCTSSTSCVGLSKQDRFQLDLFIANPGSNVNTFKRICQDSDNTTPRVIEKVSQIIEPLLDGQYSVSEIESKNDPSKIQQKSRYDRDFMKLTKQRGFPSKLISSIKAFELLEGHYNCSEHFSNDELYFCLPNVVPSDKFVLGHDYFRSIQGMRENLCAYGLPCKMEGSEMEEDQEYALESWVRCANIKSLLDESVTIRDSFDLTAEETKDIMKRLGYHISKTLDFFALPDTEFHNPMVKNNGWKTLIGLFNHIARFGVIIAKNHDSTLSAEDIFKFEMFVASVATFDVCKRVRNDRSMKNLLHNEMNEEVSPTAVARTPLRDAVKSYISTQPIMVVEAEDQDTPKQTSPKKRRIDEGSMLGYLVKKAAFTAKNVSNSTSSMFASSPSGKTLSSVKSDERQECDENPNSETFSLSCLEKEDVEVVADCFLNHSDYNAMLLTPRKFSSDDNSDYSFSLNSNEICEKASIQPSLVDVLDFEKGMKKSQEEPSFDRISVAAPNTDAANIDNQDTSSQIIPSLRKSQNKSDSFTCEKHLSCTDHTAIVDSSTLCLADQQITVRDKLESCQMALHPSFKGRQLLSKTSVDCSVSLMEDSIKDFMLKSIEFGMGIDRCTLQKPEFMYICGGPGTGKTTVVSACADDMKKWAKLEGIERPGFCFINMASVSACLNQKDGIMKTIVKKMTKELLFDRDCSITALKKVMQKRVLVLVLDEVDMLLKKRDSNGEACLRELISWSEDKDLSFSLIGISNCVNDALATRIREIGHPQEIIFPAYNEEDMLKILHDRIGEKIVDQKALQLVARKIATASGDARQVLEITSNAVGKCLESMTEDTLMMKVHNDDCMPLVSLRHMMCAIREGNAVKHADVIRGLPQLAKIVLCIAVSVGNVWGSGAEISVSTLKEFCVTATQHALFDHMDFGRLISLVEMLCDSGLLQAANKGPFNPHDPGSKLMIGVQLDDVECALEESLVRGEHGEYYKNLMEYVKSKCPNPK